jgi:hypothetical protein
MFWKKKEKTTTKIDKLVTGVIIWSAIASIFGLSKTKKWKEITSWISTKSRGVFKKSYSLFWKVMSKVLWWNKTNDK